MNCNVPELWQEHKEALYYFILKRVRDDSTAKDICQEVLLKVYSFCSSKSGVRNVRSWLFQIAHNTLSDYYRKTSRNVLTETFAETEVEEERTAFKEAAEFILPMILLLPEDYSMPLRMSDVEGRSLKAISNELGITLATAKQRVSRARKKLRDLFTECCLMELDEAGRLVSFEIRPDCGALQRYKKSLEKSI